MALNLSTLTSSATSGDVLAEALTTADFLENVPVFRNLSRGSNKGGDAKQDVALNQPKALPLDVNGKGYCYLPVTTGNAPAVTFPTIGANDDFVLEMDVYLVSGTNLHFVSGANGDHRLAIYNGSFYIGGFNVSLSSPLALGVSNIKIERTSGTITLKQNDAVIASRASSSALTFTHLSFNGQFSTSILPLNGYIQKTTLSIGGTEQLNIDFTATNIRHGDTKFKCATGQVVTINQSGNDPATVIKKSVLRFDGADDFMDGLLNQTITDGYIFMAFSTRGDGGDGSNNPRIVGLNSTGANDSGSGGLFIARNGNSSDDLILRYNANSSGNTIIHEGVYDDALGDILLESRLKAGSQISKVNNANEANGTTTFSGDLSSEEFKIAAATSGDNNTSIDLEFLAVFPASITDAQADDVRNYINNRNNVFSLIDSQGYYFFDPQALTDGDLNSTTKKLTGLWDGRIVGSDNGDASFIASQGTGDDQPTSDKYTLNFADNTDHLTITNPNQAGWQIVGTSLGTFAYKINNNSQTELNLLGNLGSASYRFAGDLYGIILLPESATGKDIEDARKLLVDRGAADGASGSSFFAAWYTRQDIVEFKPVNMTNVTNVQSAWNNTSLTAFPALDLSSATTFYSAWRSCSNLVTMGAINAENGTQFSNAWKSCTSLTSFPSGAKLGTAADNVNFTDTWRSSGLTSFPALDLSTGNNFSSAFNSCAALTSFPQDAKLGTEASGVNFSNAWNSSGLTSFSTPLPTATTLIDSFRQCNSLISFDLDEIPLATNCQTAWALDPALESFSTKLPKCGFFNAAWYNCSALTDFSADVFSEWNPSSIESLGVFNNTWDGCTSLTAQSVENILTSIDASGHYATTNKVSGGSALADAGIDIDYDGTTLSAATNSAVTSLKAKGWSLIVNNVTL
jgi:hypothetical protein